MRFAGTLVAVAALCVTAGSASAQPVVLTFEGLQSFESVGSYYNGGPGGDFGVSFTGAAQALLSVAVEDRELFKNQPSGLTVMALGASASGVPVARLLRPGGFSRISFHYASSFFAEVEFRAGDVPIIPIGSTTARIALSPNNINGIPAYNECSDILPEATYCNWTEVGFSFPGTATSVLFFTTRDNEILFDDVTVTVAGPLNTPPTISDVADQTTAEDTATGALGFTVGDAETPAGSLTVTATSSSPTLVPAANIVLGGTGATRTVTLTPAANQSGTTTITLRVDDGTATASDTFVLTVTASDFAMPDGKLYWTDSNDSGGSLAKILRANRGGTDVELLVGPPSLKPRFIALDPMGGRMYWTDLGRIDRANLDGSDVVTLVNELSCPLGIALDVPGGKVYWTDCSTIKRANLADGSGVDDVVTGLSAPSGLALDLANGKMYWTDTGTRKIQRANLDGTSQQDLVTGLDFPQAIALDRKAGKMYWSDNSTIRRANLDGTSLETLSADAGNPIGIALDPRSGKMYWTENQTRKIQRANLDGSGVEDLVTTGLDTPWGLALESSVPLVWQNDSTRQVTVWSMGGAQGDVFQGQNFLSSTGVAGWRVIARRDFNGDGSLDLVWQNDVTRQVTVWYMSGTVFQGWNYLSSAGVAGWTVVGTGDFNADTKPDLVWQNDTTRQVTVWYMGGAQGTNFQGWNYLSFEGVPGWTLVGADHFDLDAKPDLVWQHDTTRQVTVWYMGGAQGNILQGWNYLSSIGVPGWRVVAP